jgi:hypothetical protein
VFGCSEVELDNIINGTMVLGLSLIMCNSEFTEPLTVKERVPNATKSEFHISPIICNQTLP